MNRPRKKINFKIFHNPKASKPLNVNVKFFLNQAF